MEFKLKDLAILKNGKIVKPTDQDEIPVFGSNGIIGYTGKPLFNSKMIIIGRVGANCGSVHYYEGKVWLSDNTIGVEAKKNVNTYYLYYLLKYMQLHRYAGGSAQPLLNQKTLKDLNINILPINYQNIIGYVLKLIDKKIEINQKIIENLEDLSQTLFKRWFIDFEFPDENGDPYKSSGGEMVDSELGEIPKEWSIQTLNDISESYNTKRKPLSKLEREKVTSIYPYYGATKIIDYVDDYLFDGKFILVGEDGTVQTEEGHPFVQYVWGKFWVSNHAHILKGNNLSDETLMLILNNIDIEPYITGAVQPKISKKNLNGIKVIIGTKLIYEKFDQYSDIYYKKIREISEEIKNLIELRDTLLPKLMSGELEIPDDIEVNEDELSI
ncbi:MULTISPECIES: restriction endonuclease subunit S [unclassified Staphylococcus]|uniref:restriction endonuclease subunit S n=1 Tax=unclassified Staphylococcus TaxID=91994 RepID=UPI001AEC3297|nr:MULTISPECIES: restriction endonuclease subunit S [unclassified Staphylococcus]